MNLLLLSLLHIDTTCAMKYGAMQKLLHLGLALGEMVINSKILWWVVGE